VTRRSGSRMHRRLRVRVGATAATGDLLLRVGVGIVVTHPSPITTCGPIGVEGMPHTIVVSEDETLTGVKDLSPTDELIRHHDWRSLLVLRFFTGCKRRRTRSTVSWCSSARLSMEVFPLAKAATIWRRRSILAAVAALPRRILHFPQER
jgi:hypothetical protein